MADVQHCGQCAHHPSVLPVMMERDLQYNARTHACPLPPHTHLARVLPALRIGVLEQRRQQGESFSDIAKDEGVTRQAIFDRTRSRRRGSVHEVMLALSPDTRRWLVAQVPVGSSVAELLAAIVTDAHAEDQEKGQGK